MFKGIRVLYVDDEPHNLSAFKANFRRRVDILTATSAEEALELLKTETVHIILSDQRMPGMTGVEFFERLEDEYPLPVRILVTAYSDIEAVIKAINKGKVFRYLRKPWEDNEMMLAMQNAAEHYRTKDELRKKNEQLNRFVYSASHDLRSPLMSISGILQLAKMENDPRQFCDYLNMINVSVERMDKFTQNIIEYYQNERGGEESEAVDIASLAKEILELLQVQFPNAEYGVTITGGDIVTIDPFRLRVVLENILSNAFRFGRTDAEYVHQLSLSIANEDDSLSIQVQDNGRGMTDKQKTQAFDMFFKGDHPASGSGLGLFIAKEAVQKLGGNILINSQLSEGTTVNIHIPNRDAD